MLLIWDEEVHNLIVRQVRKYENSVIGWRNFEKEYLKKYNVINKSIYRIYLFCI